MQQGFAWAGVYALVVIVVVLAFDFRTLRHTLLALAPLAVGSLLTLGAMGFLGLALNPANMIALRVTKPLPVKEWTHITVTYDGSSRAAGTHVYLDGAPAAVDVDHDTLNASMLPFGQGEGMAPSVSFGSRFR